MTAPFIYSEYSRRSSDLRMRLEGLAAELERRERKARAIVEVSA